MTFYFFHQKKHKDPWTLALASERNSVLADSSPELSTVLDLDNPYEGDIQPEDVAKIKYRGPFYYDFDGEIDEVINNYQLFLTKLKDMHVNLDSLRLFCSGGKGFHIEMPAETVLTKIPPTGIAMLPAIMREMAHELYVDTLDLRVYSGKRGRMWRNPNVLRENGKYKVQITAAEAMSMTVERYAELVAHPRPLFTTRDAKFNPELSLFYAKGKDKVDGQVKRRKGKKTGAEQLKKFGGQWPETLKKMLDGSGISESAGFNQVAMQLGIVASSLGMEEEQFIKDCEALIDNFKGDGKRYSTPRARREQLREQYRYMLENPCYGYDPAAVLALCTPEVKRNTDLQGAMPQETAEGEEVVTNESEDESAMVRIQKDGIYSLGQNGWKNISEMGFSKPVLLNMPDTSVAGYEIDVHVQGKFKGRTLLTLDKLQTKAALHGFAVLNNTAFKGTDMDAANIIDTLRRRVQNNKTMAYVVDLEGVNLILPPGVKDETKLELVWTSPTAVISTSAEHYVYRQKAGIEKVFDSDLSTAEELRDCDEDRELLDKLLSMNSPQNMAKLLGWFVATFLCPFFRRFYKQFPSLQVYGPAGTGKSKSTLMLNHMHYHMHDPKSVVADATSAFAMQTIASGSSSLPVVIEELRASLINKNQYNHYINIIKSSYDGTSSTKGGLSRDKGVREVILNTHSLCAPIAWTSESLEGAAAILERCVVVAMTESAIVGRDETFEWLEERYTHMGRIGRSLLNNTLATDPLVFKEQFGGIRKELKALTKARADRPLYNLAVIITGLNFLKTTLNQIFGDEYDDRLDEMKDSITSNIHESIQKSMSEPSRVIDTLAQLSHSDEVQYQLVRGRDYTVNMDAGTSTSS